MLLFNIYLTIGIFIVLGFQLLLNYYNGYNDKIDKTLYTPEVIEALDEAERKIAFINALPIANYILLLSLIMIGWPLIILSLIFPKLVNK